MGRRASKRQKQFRGALMAGLLSIIGRLPLPLLKQLGYLFGSITAALPSNSKQITQTNLALCLPEHTEEQRAQICRASLQFSAANVLALAWVWRHPNQSVAKISNVSGDDALRQTLADGQSAIILAPHLGCWEILNFWLSTNFIMHAMFNPSGLPQVDQLILNSRETLGSIMHPATAKGVVSLVRALKKHDTSDGYVSGILPDQVPDRRSGQFAPFFGQPASTGTLPVKLLKQTGARAFMAYAHQLSNGSYEIRLRDPDIGVYDADLEVSLPALNRSIEALIMEAPEQYLWSYQRFRRRPAGEPKIY